MILASFLGRSAKFFSTAVLTAALGLSGCAVAPTAEELAATRDECSRFRAPFTQISTERNQRIARYAQIGASVGAVAGQTIARNRNDNQLAGALQGALVGAILGATGGYLADLENRSSSTAGLRRAVNGDAARDLRETDRLVSAMTSLNRCRLQQITALERSVRAGGDRTQAMAQIRLIRQKVAIDNRAINAVVGDLTRTRGLYVSALKQTGADTDTFVSSIQRYEPRVTAPQSTSLRVDRSQRPRTSNAVANLGYAERELSAGAAVHVQSIDSALDDLNDILI
ncbi:glycine zipper domain-containing protein [Octadecabacter sp. G9-8]|uniref:Glycine zipper domain-containing protein n=1 Tax=Octadecabacter dasysiphoniae TaxID=2909341 RepID=A0ABS9CY10_9RHOB|nr:glycine zipper 2TM domain-containing protein [Octadecabacter dasysiphoniae]MCF2872059.1 glycine zipper domain-containing protein [Octadecabacter dasysiphoniae]